MSLVTELAMKNAKPNFFRNVPAVTKKDKNRLYTKKPTDKHEYKISLSTTIFHTIIDSVQISGF